MEGGEDERVGNIEIGQVRVSTPFSLPPSLPPSLPAYLPSLASGNRSI